MCHRSGLRVVTRRPRAHPLRRGQGRHRLLTQGVAAQAGPYGIRANCIAPETILTERNRQQIPAAWQDARAEFHPLKRLGTPADVAAAAFLASDAAARITGVVLDIAGGTVMTCPGRGPGASTRILGTAALPAPRPHQVRPRHFSPTPRAAPSLPRRTG